MNKACISILCLSLAACSSNVESTVGATCYPEVPKMSIPKANLTSFEYDFPRDTTKKVVKNTSDCKNVPKEKQDEAFNKKCLQNPIDTNSNLYIGLDYENFLKLQKNFGTLKSTNNMSANRLEKLNEMFDTWRNKAREGKINE